MFEGSNRLDILFSPFLLTEDLEPNGNDFENFVFASLMDGMILELPLTKKKGKRSTVIQCDVYQRKSVDTIKKVGDNGLTLTSDQNIPICPNFEIHQPISNQFPNVDGFLEFLVPKSDYFDEFKDDNKVVKISDVEYVRVLVCIQMTISDPKSHINSENRRYFFRNEYNFIQATHKTLCMVGGRWIGHISRGSGEFGYERDYENMRDMMCIN